MKKLIPLLHKNPEILNSLEKDFNKINGEESIIEQKKRILKISRSILNEKKQFYINYHQIFKQILLDLRIYLGSYKKIAQKMFSINPKHKVTKYSPALWVYKGWIPWKYLPTILKLYKDIKNTDNC